MTIHLMIPPRTQIQILSPTTAQLGLAVELEAIAGAVHKSTTMMTANMTMTMAQTSHKSALGHDESPAQMLTRRCQRIRSKGHTTALDMHYGAYLEPGTYEPDTIFRFLCLFLSEE